MSPAIALAVAFTVAVPNVSGSLTEDTAEVVFNRVVASTTAAWTLVFILAGAAISSVLQLYGPSEVALEYLLGFDFG